MKPHTRSVNLFQISNLTEVDLLQIVEAAGGYRAHPNAYQRQAPSADFILNEAIIEMKTLNEEGLCKLERQKKLANLFKPLYPDRPVVVLDRNNLSKELQKKHDRIVEGPIKSAVASAKKQLAQSRKEISETSASILLVINNGYTSLDHDSLTDLVTHRVQQDTNSIDGVVVAGCYYYSDEFDSYFLWPINYVPIKLKSTFDSFPLLRKAWHDFSEKFMTDAIQGRFAENPSKYPVMDITFTVHDTTFVKPAPPIGKSSDFYIHGRPRQNTSGIEVCPSTALVFPGLSETEWRNVRAKVKGDLGDLNSFGEWQMHRSRAIEESTVLRPLITIPVSAKCWLQWCKEKNLPSTLDELRQYATNCFEEKVRQIMENARELRTIVPRIYILCITEQIGQDEANDISEIAIVRERFNGKTEVHYIAKNLRIFHEYALALAATYAVERRIECVLWRKDLKYAWS